MPFSGGVLIPQNIVHRLLAEDDYGSSFTFFWLFCNFYGVESLSAMYITKGRCLGTTIKGVGLADARATGVDVSDGYSPWAKRSSRIR